MEYTILIHSAEEGGYWSEIPALPGCFSQGETIEETIRNTKEAAESHIDALKAGREEVPREEGLLIGKIKIDDAAPSSA